MARNNLFVSVPSLFKCPISMDVMKSPVSLCTGVTYDRSSIQKWLDGGHNTCPATMQVLPSTDFIPNHTLHRIIARWSLSLESNSTSDGSPSSSSSSSVCFSSQGRALSLVRSLESSGPDNRLNCLSRMIAFAEESEENPRCFAKIDGFVPAVAGLLSSAGDDFEVLEFSFRALRLTVSETEIRDGLRKLIRESDGLLSSTVSILRGRSSEAKAEAAKVLEAMAGDAESKSAIAGREGLLCELCRFISSVAATNPMAAEAGLSALIALTASRAVKKTELVRLGMVRAVADILQGDWRTKSAGELEKKALRLLEMVSSCSEGRATICEDPTCVAAVVQRMLKASSAAATEHAVVVVWSLCYLFRDRTAQEAVMRNNGPAKILVLMQSNCTPTVRQMCADLLKAFRVSNSKSCLAGYETRTTHIMPF